MNEKLKPEEKVEIILWDWLKTKGENIKEVYFNRINKLNSPVFTTTGINKKPDFIIKIERGYGIEYIALEIKNSNQSKDVHDSGKILMYYENYISGLTKYFINNEEIKINHFAVATENSIEGHLFKEEKETIANGLSDDGWRVLNSQYGYIPDVEYIRTSDFQRRLWSEWRNLKKRLELEKKKLSSIGIIISNPNQDKLPYLFVMIYIDYNKNSKKRWGQRFWKL